MSYFERMEERRRRLRDHGFEGEPSGEQLVDYALSLEDRLNAVCAATGLRQMVRRGRAGGVGAMAALEVRLASELIQEPPVEADWIIEDLLPLGGHVIAGSPKCGKSWLCLSIGLAVSSGSPFWGFATKKCGVLYLCLEDTYERVKKRLWALSDVASERFFLSNAAPCLGEGLVEQVGGFLDENPDVRLVIVDTFQKVRRPSSDSLYAADYRDFGALKKLADDHAACLIAVHHTRKQADSDVMNTVSGTNGITGSADSTWVLSRPNRGAADATLSITGRDVQFQELKLRLKDCIWEMVGKTSEEELEERDIPDCVMRTLDFMSRGVSIWQGTMSNLMDAAGVEGVTVPVLGKHLAQNSGFMLSRGVRYAKKHTSAGQLVTLQRIEGEGGEGSEGKLAI